MIAMQCLYPVEFFIRIMDMKILHMRLLSSTMNMSTINKSILRSIRNMKMLLIRKLREKEFVLYISVNVNI